MCSFTKRRTFLASPIPLNFFLAQFATASCEGGDGFANKDLRNSDDSNQILDSNGIRSSIDGILIARANIQYPSESDVYLSTESGAWYLTNHDPANPLSRDSSVRLANGPNNQFDTVSYGWLRVPPAAGFDFLWHQQGWGNNRIYIAGWRDNGNIILTNDQLSAPALHYLARPSPWW